MISVQVLITDAMLASKAHKTKPWNNRQTW